MIICSRRICNPVEQGVVLRCSGLQIRHEPDSTHLAREPCLQTHTMGNPTEAHDHRHYRRTGVTVASQDMSDAGIMSPTLLGF